ncbi:MAG TPA: hypothetical protein VE779_06345, partial [Candidatus Angelobacter sp.]|nr:hypothetical protein [Candidatus Angelobacter sp.]
MSRDEPTRILRRAVCGAVLLLGACTGVLSGPAPESAGDPDAGGLPLDGGTPLRDAGAKPDAGEPGDAGQGNSTDAFPPTSIFYEDISSAALDPNSAAIINQLAQVGWGSGAMQIDFSITILHADSSVQPRAFTPANGYYTPDCDMTAVPVPPGGNSEGSTDYACDTTYQTPGQGDCHLLVYQGARLYELYNTTIAGGQAAGSPFTTLCAVVWD